MLKIKDISISNSKSNKDNILIINNSRITVLTDNLFRIETCKEKLFEDKATQTVLYRNNGKVDFKTKQIKNNLFIETTNVILRFNIKLDKALTITFKDTNKTVKCNNFNNLKSTKRTLDQSFGKEKLDYGLMSLKGVSIYDDSNSLILEEDGTIHQRENKEKDIYIFAYGNDYRRCLYDFYKLTGFTPLIPRFALGVWWSRYRAYSQEEYMQLITSFKEHNIPLSVATIDMDWHWVDIKGLLKEEYDESKMNKRNSLFYSDGWTGYSWNTDLFYDYKTFLKWLHEQNLKVTVNLHPSEGVRYFENQYVDMANAVGIDPKSKEPVKISFSNPKFIDAYFKILHHPYEKDGVDFWWIDWQQGKKSDVEGLDPLWALNHYHFLDKANNDKGLILSRYAGVGSHRYPIGFSGDTHVRWSVLKFQPYFTINANNIGYTWWSHDIGGHMLGYRDDELYLRWIQFGVFSPIMRLHSSSNDLSGKEPYRYPSHIKDIAIKWLQLRSKLVPYIFSLNYLTHKDGLPLCEAMYYRYPKNKNSYKVKNQYMFGDLLIAPITSKCIKSLNLAKVKVWLPEGTWTDIFTNKKYEGNQMLTMYRDLNSFPVLAKDGSIIPLNSKIANGVDFPEEMNVLIYKGNGKFTLVEEKQNKYSYVEFIANDESKDFCIRIDSKDDGKIINFERNYNLMFKDILYCKKVKIFKNGVIEEEKELQKDKLTSKTLQLNIKNVKSNDTIEIKLYDCEKMEFIEYRSHIVDIMSKWQKGSITKSMKYYSIKKYFDDKEKCYRKILKTHLNKDVKLALLEAFKQIK